MAVCLAPVGVLPIGPLTGADDVTGAADDLADDLADAAADNLKRVIRPRSADGDWTGSPSLHRMHAYLETKTVWHPTGT